MFGILPGVTFGVSIRFACVHVDQIRPRPTFRRCRMSYLPVLLYIRLY